MTLGHRVAVLDDGRLQQFETPRELYDQPANRFVAGFIGSPAMNLCAVPCSNGSVTLGGRAACAAGARSTGARRSSSDCARRRSSWAATASLREVEVVEEFGADAYVFCAARLHDGKGETTRLVARAEARSAPKRGERVALRSAPARPICSTSSRAGA